MKWILICAALFCAGCGDSHVVRMAGVIKDIGNEKEVISYYGGKYQPRTYGIEDHPYTDVALDDEKGMIRIPTQIGELGERVVVSVYVDDQGKVITKYGAQ